MTIEEFIQTHLSQSGRPIPARLQTALALLQKLRVDRSLLLQDHLASAGSSGLKSHETWGREAHERWDLVVINSTHGRRSSHLGDWGQDLLDLLAEEGFQSNEANQDALIDRWQQQVAGHIRALLEEEPIQVKVRGRTAHAVIGDALTQAHAKGKSGDVAQYLVGAKLSLRLKREIPIHGANRRDRRSRGDLEARTGDFEIENATIEIALGLPDEKHISQILDVLEKSDNEVWLLTRSDRVAAWQNELKSEEIDSKRVVISSVESFVGQNISELGEFSASGKKEQLEKLFRIYNDQWVSKCGFAGLRIEVK